MNEMEHQGLLAPFTYGLCNPKKRLERYINQIGIIRCATEFMNFHLILLTWHIL